MFLMCPVFPGCPAFDSHISNSVYTQSHGTLQAKCMFLRLFAASFQLANCIAREQVWTYILHLPFYSAVIHDTVLISTPSRNVYIQSLEPRSREGRATATPASINSSHDHRKSHDRDSDTCRPLFISNKITKGT